MNSHCVVYIDGFNLYYGMLKDGQHKWLDIGKYFSLLRHRDNIRKIFYFTSPISGPKRENQQRYLEALRQSDAVEIVLGKFSKKTVLCQVKKCKYEGKRVFVTAEEKGTDVNIAIQMISDAYGDLYGTQILVTGDGDLAPAIRMVKRNFNKRIIVYTPATYLNKHHRYSGALEKAADTYKFLPESLLKHSLFPDEIPDGRGGVIRKPAGW